MFQVLYIHRIQEQPVNNDCCAVTIFVYSIQITSLLVIYAYNIRLFYSPEAAQNDRDIHLDETVFFIFKPHQQTCIDSIVN